MKNFKYLILAVFFIAVNLTSAFSQDQKFAHINRNEIMQQMPEMKQAQKNLEEYTQELQSQVQNLMKEYRTKLQSLEEKGQSMSETVRSDKQKEIKSLEERIQSFRQQAQEDVRKKEQELMKPIIDKLTNAIEKVAQEKGYTYVLDESRGGILYAEDSQNITPLVKQELGL